MTNLRCYNQFVDNHYKGLIWTNHVLQRLRERNIKQGDAWATFSNPQSSKFAKKKNAWIFYRNYVSSQIEVVATQNEKKEWIILSVWSKEINSTQTKNYVMIGKLENMIEKVLQKLLGGLRKK